MTSPYIHKSAETALIKAFKHSRSEKIKSQWSRLTGTGFIAEDIESIERLDDHAIAIKTPSFVLKTPMLELNLRETEECIKFLELKLLREALQKREAIIECK
jgi:hypothetical protein